MWTASLSSIQPWLPITRPTFATVKAPLQAGKFRFRRTHDQERCYDDDDDDDEDKEKEKSTGGVGQAVLAAYKSIPPQQLERQLSGSDVLRALQKASVEKAKRSRKQKRSKDETLGLGGRGGDHQLDDSDTSICPLSIQTEWGVRLEQLENRLRDIMLLDN